MLGTVTDASGASVPNAPVIMTETNTGVSRSTRTGEAGNYAFGDVPQGAYTVSVELAGFKKAVRSGVDVLVNQLSPTYRKPVVLFSLFCGALFTGVVGTMGASFVIGLYPTDQTSPDLEIPSWLVYLCLPLGSYLMCFRFLQVAWTFWRTGELPHHDPGHVEGVDKDAVAKELA